MRVLDLEFPVEGLSLVQADGRPYRSALLLIRRAGRPVGVRALALDDAGCASPATVSATLADVESASPPRAPVTAAKPSEVLSVGVVVTTCSNHEAVVRCVDALLACEYPQLEVVVVENRPVGSRTHAALRARFGDDPRIRYVEEPRAGLSFARNAGLAATDSEVVAFTDDDVVVDRGWLHALVGAFSPGVACVTGLIMPLALDVPVQELFERFAGFGKGFDRRAYRAEDAREDRLFPYAPGTFGSGANTALRRSVIERLGGFDVKLGVGTAACGGEDLDLYIRLLLAGEQIVYEPAALVFHDHPGDARGLRRRVFNYGVGLTAMLTKQLLSGPRIPLLRAAPSGIRYGLDSGSRKNVARGPAYPLGLTGLERLGMLVGPVAYALSARRAKALARTGATADAPPFVPAAVRSIELDEPLTDLELGCSADGTPYGSVLALARLHGEPLAMVEVAAQDSRLSAGALGDALVGELGEAIERHARTHGCLEPGAASRAALARGLRPAFRCPSSDRVAGETPFVSVIVPTAGRPERLRACLESLRRLEYPSFEVVVVDNAPQQPGTRAVVDALATAGARVRYVAERLPGSSVARNRGVREAAGELLAFTDDDVVVDPRWLTWMVEPFLTDGRVGVVTGLVLPARMDTPDQRWFEELSGFGKGFVPRRFDLDANRADERLLYPYWGGVFGSGNSMAFRRSVLNRIGGFDPALGAGSRALAGADIDAFSHAILTGARLAYEPRAICWHDHRVGAAALDTQMFNYGVGLTAILTKWLVRDPRLVGRLVAQGLRALASLARGRGDGPALPQEVSRLSRQLHMNRRRRTLGRQVRGYCLGPLFYVRSVLWARRLKLHAVLRGSPDA